MKEQTSELQGMLEKMIRLGQFTKCDGLASGFDPYEHTAELDSLMCYLGDTFPIPILEMATKQMREKSRSLKFKVKEELYNQGLGDEVKLRDGSLLQVKTAYNTEIKDKVAFLDWLNTQGYGSKIKTSFVFEKGERIEGLVSFLSDAGIHYEKDTSINWNSLKAVMKELIEDRGVAPDSELAIVTQEDYVVIKKKN